MLKILRCLFKPEVSAVSYAVVFRVGFSIMAASIFAIFCAWLVQRDLNKRLEAQIEAVNVRFEQMSQEHERAVEAANTAIKARDEIYAVNRIRMSELEKILNLEPDFDNLALPEHLRLFLERNSIPPASRPLPAPGSPVERH